MSKSKKELSFAEEVEQSLRKKFRKNIWCKFTKAINEYELVKPGDRIAQLILMPYIPIDFIEVGELEETERGAGGFGSTGE